MAKQKISTINGTIETNTEEIRLQQEQNELLKVEEALKARRRENEKRLKKLRAEASVMETVDGWVARDKCGNVYLYPTYPQRLLEEWWENDQLSFYLPKNSVQSRITTWTLNF